MILILAGAGASKAVDPTKYPTTVEFFEKLPDNIKSNTIFKNLEGYLRQGKSKDAPIDIEEILWTIYELEDFSAAISNKGNLIGWFLNDLTLLQSLGGNYDVNPLKNVAKDLVDKSFQLTRQISEQVYSFYADAPNQSDLELNWLPLLRNLGKRNEQIEIFTTNYDVVIESALDILSQENKLLKIKTGRVNTVQPYLDATLWEEQKDSQQNDKEVFGLLTKLHGSIDWSRNVNTIFVGTPLYTGDPGRHVILYPGYKGGYYPSNNAIVYIIDPREKIENITIPAKKTVHIKKGFDESSVQELRDNLA